jgi:hypothetical protein
LPAHHITLQEHTLLWECDRRIRVDEDIFRMTALLRADATVEAHIIRRLQDIVALDPWEEALLDQAYGQSHPIEALLPVSFASEIAKTLAACS